MIFRNRFLFQLIVTIVSGLMVVGSSNPGFSQEVSSAVPSVVVEDAVKPEFIYSPIGYRDPFVPLVQQINKLNAKPEKNKGPLEKFELSQFRLIALLIVQGTPRAMVKAPDGRSYMVKPGDLMGSNGGVVKRIETKTVVMDEASGQRVEKSPDRVVVEVTSVDSYTGKEFKDYRYVQM